MAQKAKILLGDQDETTTLRLSAILSASHYDVVKANDLDDFLSLIQSFFPDAILLGQFDNIDQIDAAEKAKALHAPRALPTLLFNAATTEDARLKAIASGVQDIIPGVPSDSLLLSRLTLLTRISTMQNELQRRIDTAAEFGVDVDPWASNRFKGKDSQVLIIAQEDENPEVLKKSLEEYDLRIDVDHDFYRAADRLDAERFDAAIVIIKDADSKEQALYLCSHLRNNPRQFNMPVILLPYNNLLEDIEEGYRSGATIVDTDCQDFQMVATQCKMLVQTQRAKWSMRDPMLKTLAPETMSTNLHGVYSENFLTKHLQRQIDSYSERNGDLSMAVFAIRNAPDVLERFGQEACDMLLQQMADWIQGLLRNEDLTARVSDYEFAVVLPDTPEKIASMVANRITGILHHSEFRLTDEIMEAINVWVDLGVCGFEKGDTSSSFLKRAQDSIY